MNTSLILTLLLADDNEFRKHQASTLVRSYLSSIDKLNNKIEETQSSSSLQPQTEVNESPEIHEENNHNPWTNNLEEQWSTQRINTDDLFEQETEQPSKVWQPDHDTKSCMICTKRFGLLLRRHHCRKCGQVVCDKCSPWKVFLNPSDILQDPAGILESVSVLATQQQRICDNCYSAN